VWGILGIGSGLGVWQVASNLFFSFLFAKKGVCFGWTAGSGWIIVPVTIEPSDGIGLQTALGELFVLQAYSKKQISL